jgi:hypothetical protein
LSSELHLTNLGGLGRRHKQLAPPPGADDQSHDQRRCGLIDAGDNIVHMTDPGAARAQDQTPK